MDELISSFYEKFESLGYNVSYGHGYILIRRDNSYDIILFKNDDVLIYTKNTPGSKLGGPIGVEVVSIAYDNLDIEKMIGAIR